MHLIFHTIKDLFFIPWYLHSWLVKDFERTYSSGHLDLERKQVQVKNLTFRKHLHELLHKKLGPFISFHSLTLNEEEEADDAHDCDDDSRNDEGHAPVGGDPVSSDQRAQDVSY